MACHSKREKFVDHPSLKTIMANTCPRISSRTQRCNIFVRADESRSWLPTGIVPHYFEQGMYSCCWSIPPAIVTQSVWALYGDVDSQHQMFPDENSAPTTLKLSPQAAIDGIPSLVRSPEAAKVFSTPVSDIHFEWEADGAYGLATLHALQYAKSFGFPSLAEYKYTGRVRDIRTFRPILRPVRFVEVELCNVVSAVNKAPIVGNLDFFSDFYGYASGRYASTQNGAEKPISHDVVITRYGGNSAANNYFEIQNSWNAWGINGTSVAHISPERFTGFYAIQKVESLFDRVYILLVTEHFWF